MKPAVPGPGEGAVAAKTLVVYYSRSGYTRRVAEQVARAARADLLPIGGGKRAGMLGYLRCVLEAWLHLPARITPTRLPGQYDLVVIGTPVWCWNMSSPVRAYLARHQNQFKRVAFFCTYGGAGAPKVFADMQALSGRQAVATLGLSDAQIQNAETVGEVAQFAARLGTSPGAPPKSESGRAGDGTGLAHF